MWLRCKNEAKNCKVEKKKNEQIKKKLQQKQQQQSFPFSNGFFSCRTAKWLKYFLFHYNTKASIVNKDSTDISLIKKHKQILDKRFVW